MRARFVNEEASIKIPKDDRKLSWPDIEDDIRFRANKKQKDFKLKGPWKKFKENRDGFKVYAVDGEWVRNNLSIIFGHGGHGYVHEFIPLDEIWIATHHYSNEGPNGVNIECGCKLENKKITNNYYLSCVVHEIAERELMQTGNLDYWTAHQMARTTEKEMDIIPKSQI